MVVPIGSSPIARERVAMLPDLRVPSDDVRVLVVDDHPALRQGLEGLLTAEPGFACAGATTADDRLISAVSQAHPHVVVIDPATRRGRGLATCFWLKQMASPPGVVVYSARPDRLFAYSAAVAQADATVSKAAPVSELLHVIRQVAAGRATPEPLDPELMHAASARLPGRDLPIAGMLLARVPIQGIADVLALRPSDVYLRALHIISRLQATPLEEPSREQQRMMGSHGS
jgi:DNA-binding NarL/FixJ family response regulator